MNYKKYFLSFAVFLAIIHSTEICTSQTEGVVGNQTILTVKSYKPILAESSKIFDEPDADTTTGNVPVFSYSQQPVQMETNYESGVIQAKKVKDETISKLYRSYLKLGAGNYEKVYGELYVNSLRSKNTLLGFHVKHFSAAPKLNGVDFGGYSDNAVAVNGKFFLDKLDISTSLNYDRNVVHYYGFSPKDTIIDKDDFKQQFNLIGFNAGVQSRYREKDHLQFGMLFDYKSLKDAFDVNESNFEFNGMASKKIGEAQGKLNIDFDYFKKTDASFQLLTSNSNVSRNIIRFGPEAQWKMEKLILSLGVGIEFQKNLETSAHLFPRIHLVLPIAEKILSAYADVDGKVIKNTYNTLRLENPFITSAVIPINMVEKYKLSTGLRGNISSALSFHAGISYAKFSKMNFYISDTLASFPARFNILYADAKRVGVHAEISYKSNEKFNVSFAFNQFVYSVESLDKPFHRPATEASLRASYNLKNKIVVNFILLGEGSKYSREETKPTITIEKIKGYANINLGIEYRYSKIISFYINLNNLGFSKYYNWYGYPNEGLNILGGLTFSFWPYNKVK